VAAFGLQQFPHSTKATTSSPADAEWHIVLALQNGCINALSLPNLRRDLKVAFTFWFGTESPHRTVRLPINSNGVSASDG
ncbi:unnamed protein product, partial [Dibothriocephalus latus]